MSDVAEQTYVDPVEEASVESFPASDPPGWAPLRSGEPVRVSQSEFMSHAERLAWNRALESAALAVEGADAVRQQLSRKIRSMKRSVTDRQW